LVADLIGFSQVVESLLSNIEACPCLVPQETKQYSDKLNQIRSQMAKIDMPGWLETSIFDYYQYLYDRFSLVDATFESFLWELPDSVHVEIKWHMHGPLLRKVYLFQDCTEFFVMQALPISGLCCMLCTCHNIAIQLTAAALRPTADRKAPEVPAVQC
jgi:hypothetical protein